MPKKAETAFTVSAFALSGILANLVTCIEKEHGRNARGHDHVVVKIVFIPEIRNTLTEKSIAEKTLTFQKKIETFKKMCYTVK